MNHPQRGPNQYPQYGNPPPPGRGPHYGYDQNPYPPHQYDHGAPPDGYYDRPPEGRSRDGRGDRGDSGANTLANIVDVLTSVIVLAFVLHILFVVFDANQGNQFVSAVYTLAKTLVLGLGDVFTPNDALLGVVLNYGVAALVYLVIGRLIARALRRR
ncbi:hypothetical protein [Saccharopolyspora sp. SCSIO 74807]|uniref:hypothetical protein n=1 Tax=Saccharopolyspora sp. SCSIO 74807 TaxID=3118084 RepID=UPI0030D31CCA